MGENAVESQMQRQKHKRNLLKKVQLFLIASLAACILHFLLIHLLIKIIDMNDFLSLLTLPQCILATVCLLS